MTLLMCRVERHRALIVTDELVGSSDPARAGWYTKVQTLPHHGVAVTGSGLAQLVDILTMEARLRSADDCLAEFLDWTSATLREIWSNFIARYGEDAWREVSECPEQPSRVYVLGQGSITYGKIGWYKLSPPDFEAEQLRPSLVLSPYPKQWPKGTILEPFETLDEMIDLAKRIKAERDEQLGDNRVGGALMATTITPGTAGPTFTQQIVHTFEDRDDVLARLRSVS